MLYGTKITILDKKRNFIYPGQYFEKDVLIPSTFESSLKDGTIFEKGKEPIIVKSGSKKQLVNSNGLVLDEAKRPGTIKDLINRENSKKKEPVAAIWDAPPEELKGLKFEQLMSIYHERCAEFDIVPINFGTIEEVKAQLTSQYVKK